ncbi:recombinase family protein [Thermoflavimicrobium daqui]|jgi:DNA invertase Pin-like site-specific DNA recombinase|uniref:Recombinase family protein n=1 Tax=Thermoflavimicrobium daqui TaxID=2137476 RepID=A0A364K8V1_9BACL|nr:recombinase family protein [Thermoflavimicrobium daqui]RAL26723.1 recombinase family protein [Thermoflavimicrobium daqui]
MKSKYAVYVRVSTDRDEQVSSVENQIDICRNWLERNGYEWDENAIYKDHGISGTLFLERPAIQLLLEKAKKKEMDMVVFKSISRLARDLKDSLEIRETFIAHNVRIISIEEGYDSNKAGKNDMAFELWSLFAAQYSRTLSAGITAALAAKVRRGEHVGRIPYGYDREEGFLKINQEEAKVVRQIFDWYLNGWGYKRITLELNQLNIKPKNKSKWQVTSVQRMIQNPIYCGDFILNQYTTIKVGGRKKQIRNPKEKWLIFKDHHMPIISREQWEAANYEKKSKVKSTAWNDLRGIIKCSECGSHMVIVQSCKKLANGEKKHYYYLKCSAYRRAAKAGCVNHHPITYEDIRAFIISQLKEKGQSISFHFVSELESKKRIKMSQLQKQKAQLEEKKKDLLDVYLDKLIGKQEFELKRNELDHRMEQIEVELVSLNKREYVQKRIHNIQQAFAALENEQQDLLQVFKTLLNQVEVHPDGTIDLSYSFQGDFS